MKIDFSQPVAILGEPIVLEKDAPATLGSTMRFALNQLRQEEQSMALEDMVRRGRLALRLAEQGEQEVTPEELVMMRNSLRIFTRPELVVILYDMLDPK